MIEFFCFLWFVGAIITASTMDYHFTGNDFRDGLVKILTWPIWAVIGFVRGLVSLIRKEFRR